MQARRGGGIEDLVTKYKARRSWSAADSRATPAGSDEEVLPPAAMTCVFRRWGGVAHVEGTNLAFDGRNEPHVVLLQVVVVLIWPSASTIE
jgi:hypothetical protein